MNVVNSYPFIRFLFCLLICINSFSVDAQQYNFRHFTTKNGLPHPFINNIFCDSKGFIWLSTQGGLSRYDGNSFTNYTSKDGLPGSDILCSAEDAKGNLWIGTNGFGVVKFNGSKFITYNSKKELKSDIVYSVFKDNKNNIWIATQGGGVTKFDGKKFTTLTTNDGLPTNDVFSIAQDKKGDLWFSCKDNGPVRYDGKKFHKTTHERLSKLTVFSIYCDNEGTIWAGTAGEGLWYSKGNTFEHYEDERISVEFISSIKEDAHHNFWIATDNQLVKINGSKKFYYTIENGLTSNTIYSLGFDHDGKLWIGTINGVNIFVNEAFTNFNEKNGLTNNNVTVFCRNNDGDLLIGTAGNGLNVFKDNVISSIPILPLEQANILTLLHASDDKIYIGLNNSEQGVVVLEKKKGKFVVAEQIKELGGESFSSATSIVEREPGEIIIATYGSGLWTLHNGTLTNISDQQPVFSNTDFMTAFVDSKKNVWLSLNNGGVIVYNGKAFKKYTTKNGLGDNTVHSFCEDKVGNIIMGNYENGITLFNGKKFITYNINDKLCSNNVQAVACDKHGNIWVGTGVGLNRIVLDKEGKIVSIKLFNESNGLIGTEINQNGLFVDPVNNLWIGSNEGMTRYNSFFDYKNTVPPSIVLNQIKLNFLTPDWKAKGISIDKKTSLPINPTFAHNDNHLTFTFQALTIDEVQFSYILEGSDDEWTPLSRKNEADFTNISPGDYTFRVRAINSDGVKSKEDLTFKFSILPPFWQTWWFRISAGIFIIALIVLIIKRRTAQLAKEKKILEEKVNIRTQELSVANSHLSVALHDIKDSIHYAQKIQQSILPNDKEFSEIMQDSFVLFKPKDIVSGDFYWLTKKNGSTIYATADCTGHGVPGGFMTMLGTSFLNEIVNEQKASVPGEILNQMRERIIDALKQTGAAGENKDGMDMVMCIIDSDKKTLQYAAANNGFYIVRNGELLEMKADKQPIGYFTNQHPFTTGNFALEPGDVIYTFTDGYADQFGGPAGKKFKYKQLEQLLVANYNKPMQVQKEKLNEAIENWMKDYEQIDDILVIGYKVSNEL